MPISTSPQGPSLELVKETKIYRMLPSGDADSRLEASGVCAKDGVFYVIFDNSPHVARLDGALRTDSPANALLRQRGESAGFEDIAYHEGERRFLIIIEALIHPSGTYKPDIEEYSKDFRYLEHNWVNFALEGEHKGLEGLTYVRRDERDYVLGLCEGNRCRAGKRGRKPGGGRIQIFQKGAGQWEHQGTLRIPKAVRVEDYASLDASGNRLAVISQASSALWVGVLQENAWDFADAGVVYPFPTNEDGETIYCNIEGVSWIAPDQIVVVSDKCKPGEQPKICQQKDQSIHVFRIPGAQ